MQFVTFMLYAPLASWGDIAIGEVRDSWDRPSRSAILGLIAGALGISRDRQGDHDRLDSALGVGVWLAAPGTALVDYHTTQNPTGPDVRRHRPRTRREALGCARPEQPPTTLSTRALRQDALALIAVWPREGSAQSESVAQALCTPAFVPYAGRKANVLAFPMMPRVIEAATLVDAFRGMLPIPGALRALRPRSGWAREIAFDDCVGFDSGITAVSTHRIMRRDAKAHRGRWQFATRYVNVGMLPQWEDS